MGLIASYVSPGVQLTKAKYDNHLSTIYSEFNGNIDNNNIKATAGIVDSKLATITTAGKVAESALPTTYASLDISGNITVGGLVDGVDIAAHHVATTGVHGVGGSAVLSAAHTALTTGIHGAGGSTVASAADIDADVATHSGLATGVHGAGGSTVATAADIDADVTTHSGLATGVHGAGGNTLATAADIDADVTTHSGLATGVHGAGGSTVASAADIATHAALDNNAHGVISDSDVSIASVYKNSKSAISLTADTWTTITITIPSGIYVDGARISGFLIRSENANCWAESYLYTAGTDTCHMIGIDQSGNISQQSETVASNTVRVRVRGGTTNSNYVFRYQIIT